MRKVLGPIDGSDNALRALNVAIGQLRSVPGAELHLLTVHPPVRVYGEIQVYASHERMEELAAQHARDILAPAEARPGSAGIRWGSEQLEGDPAETIVRRAADLGCDAIVMGTRGLGRVENLVLGSVAFKVVHLATVPVTLVR
jgi:nucleotide-binding universal stress UspA family protein